jgi:hypothetical protein
MKQHQQTFPKGYSLMFENLALFIVYLTLRSVLSLNNPQNSEMKFVKCKVHMLKIIITIIGYTLNNFTTHMTIL